jgi:outer membrane translocation and assembly module TamA
VRGFPDGLKFGRSAAFNNLEARKIIYKSKHLWIQGLTFLDSGMAADSWAQAFKETPLTSTGIGFRFAIPQIYRLMFRIDYAWSLVDTSRGISAGMNQFFDPYNPL